MPKTKLLFTLILLSGCLFAQAQVALPVWVNDVVGGYVYGICTDKQDNIYVAGGFGGSTNLNPLGKTPLVVTSKGLDNSYMAKYTANGLLVWGTTFGSTGRDIPVSICLDGNQNIYVTGTFSSPTLTISTTSGPTVLINSGLTTIFLIKLDNSGNILWAKGFGGTAKTTSEVVKADNSGNVFLGGLFTSATDFGAGKVSPFSRSDGFLAKYDAAGNLSWFNHFGGTSPTSSSDPNVVFDLNIDVNNNILATGSFAGTSNFDFLNASPHNMTSTINTGNSFFAKYATNGKLIWIDPVIITTKQPTISPSTTNIAITTDASANIYISSGFDFPIDLDVASATLGKYPVNGIVDAYIATYDTNGAFLTSTHIGSPGMEIQPTHIILDNKNNFYISGFFQGPPDFNSVPGTTGLTTFPGLAPFVAKYTNAGNYVWGINVGPANNSHVNSASGVALTATNDVILAGQFNSQTDFDPRACSDNYTSLAFGYDGFIARYTFLPSPIVTGFTLPQQKGAAVIDTVNRTIKIIVKNGTDLTKLTPTITINSPITNSNGTFNNGTLSPASGIVQDISAPFTYHILANCISYDYVVTVTTTYAAAGANQSACNTSSFVLNANVPPSGETGTWSVVSPTSYMPFDQNNISNPLAVIKNVPADTKVVLKWTVIDPSIPDTATSAVNIVNYSIPVINNAKTWIVSKTSPSVTLRPSVSGIGPFTYLWQPGSTLSDSTAANPLAFPTKSTTYKLTVTNANGCSTSAPIIVLLENGLVVPSSFTPNNDGINDTWTIKNIEGYPNCEVSVYNRNGLRLYYSKGYSIAWDGTYNGKKLPEGSYYYLIKANDNKNQTFSGTVTLMY